MLYKVDAQGRIVWHKGPHRLIEKRGGTKGRVDGTKGRVVWQNAAFLDSSVLRAVLALLGGNAKHILEFGTKGLGVEHKQANTQAPKQATTG